MVDGEVVLPMMAKLSMYRIAVLLLLVAPWLKGLRSPGSALLRRLPISSAMRQLGCRNHRALARDYWGWWTPCWWRGAVVDQAAEVSCRSCAREAKAAVRSKGGLVASALRDVGTQDTGASTRHSAQR